MEEVPVKIAPNPATDFIVVDLPEKMNSEEAIIALISADGKVVKNHVMTGSQATINVNDLPTGMYVLKLISETATAQETIIVR